MTDRDPKETLRHYLQEAREALVWKTEGLSERDLRMPRTVTGTNLLGLVKHCTAVEIGYLGHTFGRPFPAIETEAPWALSWVDPSVPEVLEEDMWATESEPAARLVALYRRVWAHGDATIAALDLDSPGRVPWWDPTRADVTLHHVLVHVVAELQRHAGHADILREGIDGAAGVAQGRTNLWTAEEDRPAYVARLRALAERFPAG
ncbi:DinB family protein [Xylanimonas protaetiae]|uniref:DinB family protein n=1 Tax=Xylanimonas protaetiae TaxID=2509457 RepID=A0A4P6F115_9MICO|nr:DinB family protein [Xylanimonas protaetiae]QAY69440.1 DinB family protein [Xylanimonas protaetiae]